MSRPLTPPIFVWTPGDLGVFDDIGEAQMALEAIDVRDDYYVAFDAEGRRLRLGVKPPAGRMQETVVIEAAEEEPSGQDDFRAILEQFLGSLGEDAAQFRQLPLRELGRLAHQHSNRIYLANRWPRP